MGTVMDWGIPHPEYTDGTPTNRDALRSTPHRSHNFDGPGGSTFRTTIGRRASRRSARGDADGHGYFAYGVGTGREAADGVHCPGELGGAAERPQDARGGGPYRPAAEHLDEKQSGEGWREALAPSSARLLHGMQLHLPSAAIDLTIGKTPPMRRRRRTTSSSSSSSPRAPQKYRVPNSRKADEVKVSLSAVPCARTVRVTPTPCSMSGGKLGCDFEPSVNEQPLPACAEPSDAFLKEKGGTKTAPHFWNTTAAAQAARTQAAAARRRCGAHRDRHRGVGRRARGAPPRAAAVQQLDTARAAARRARRLSLSVVVAAAVLGTAVRASPAARRRLGGRGCRPRRHRGRSEPRNSPHPSPRPRYRTTPKWNPA